MYHRWFMLSETVFNERFLNPSKEQIEARNRDYDLEIDRNRTAGKLDICQQLQREREAENRASQASLQRFEILTSSIAKVLLERNAGQSIELFVQEREIPFPEQVAQGMRLNDESLLSELLKIGELDGTGFRLVSPKPDSDGEPAK